MPAVLGQFARLRDLPPSCGIPPLQPSTTVKHIYTYAPRRGPPLAEKDDYACCIACGELLSACRCVCEFCGERDGCECALFDSATGGG